MKAISGYYWLIYDLYLCMPFSSVFYIPILSWLLIAIKGTETNKLLKCDIIQYSPLIDGWYNNCNFLIIFFLFMSYIYLDKNKMWISGIFFALSTIKINSVLFLPVLLLVRKIKFKDLVYYLVPFFLLCLHILYFQIISSRCLIIGLIVHQVFKVLLLLMQ